MWPWEHLSVGYLLYSAAIQAVYRRPPEGYGAVVLAVGTQFPDLIDKPGSWVFGVLPSGTSLAHSVFVALPVTLVTLELARRRGRPELGIAFGIGYLSHLLGDVLYPVLLGRSPGVGAVLWPLVSFPPSDSPGVIALVFRFFSQYVEYLSSPAGLGYVLLEVSLLALAFAVWVLDQTPGVGAIRRVQTAVRNRGGHN